MAMAARNLLLHVVGAALLAAAVRADDLHTPFAALLAKYVDAEGKVAYRSLAQQDAATLDAYLQALERADPGTMSPAEQTAFWINAYNAHVIRGVLDGYDAEGRVARLRFFGFYSFPVAGRKRTLNDIENDILRGQLHEPRIHFALVCASTSCPKLRREAYRGDRLEAQLDEQARSFLDDPTRNQFGPGGIAKLSSIFKWFADDFVRAAGSVPAFIGRYRQLPAGARIEYLDYDWSINAQPGQRPE